MVVGQFTEEVDVMVIGGGPGGYVAAIRAAQLGKKVTIVDADKLGGVCLNRGCIPSKALIQAAHNYEHMQNSNDNGMGISAEGVSVDFEKVQAWKNSVVDRLTGGVEALLKGNNVEIVSGRAVFEDEDIVRVDGEEQSQRFQFEQCIVATGSSSRELPSFPFGERIISSTEALELTEIPKSMAVLGGGYIGIELGQTFAKFGTDVTIIEYEKQILPGFEKQLAVMVQKKLKQSGATIVTRAEALSAEQTNGDVTVTYKHKDEEKELKADYLLVTVGRTPNTDSLGLDKAKVNVNDNGYIEVDHQCRTSNSNVFAIGDIVPGPALAHKASYEGKVAAEVIAGEPSVVDYKCIPSVVFSDPEVATVGYTEKEAKDDGYDVVAAKFPYAANGRALSLNEKDGFVKIVANKENDVVIGAQIIGADASNLIAEIALAIEMSATLEDIALTIHAHPTLAEMTMEAAEVALGRPIHMK